MRFEYDVASPNHTGIVLESGKEVVFKNLRFLIVTDASPESVVAMLGIQGVGRVRFEKCIFAQQNEQPLSAEGIPIASVAIESPTGADNQGPTVTFDECLAEGIATSANATVNHGGQAAVAINGPATVKATNCAFRPHGAFFHLRDKCSLEKTVVQVQNCAGLVQKGPAFRFDDNAFAQLTVNRNIFSNPGGSVGLLAGLPQPYLISLAKPVQVQYLGDHNRYHLNAMVEKKAAGSITTPEGFKAYIELNDGSDQNALYINPNPLDPADNPWQQTGGLEDLAFQLKAQPEFDNIGLRNTWMGRPMPPAPNIAKIVTTTNEKIVDADDKTPGIFNNIEAALLSAVNGDVIKIKHGKTSNEIPVALGKLKQNVAVTLKPFNDTYHPVLVLGQNKADATLFQLELKSRLQIEDMNIVLDPKEGFEKPDTRSVVQMGDAAVVFKKCTFTLRSTDNSVALNVVTFIGLEQMSKMEGKPGNPLVEFHDCFVRGKGNLVALRGCRKLHVKVAGSLIALNGSLLDIQATTKVMAMSEGVTWDMVGSSVYTTESLFAFHSNFDGGVLTENTARIDHCLIAALVAEQPVVFPDMPMAAKLKKFLRWEGEQNFYANFGRDRLMDWKEQFEKELRSGRLSFSAKLTDEAKRPPLWDAQTDWFRLPEAEEQMLSGVGLPVESFEKLLPPPEAPALPADEQ